MALSSSYSPDRTPEYLPWQDDALCAQVDPEAFFPDKGGSTKAAKTICAACPVASECLEYAIQNGERHGIWGGKSERERREIAVRRGLRQPDGWGWDLDGDSAAV